MRRDRYGLCVITYNRLDYLKKCIAALDANSWGGAKLRVVVDDGSDQEGYPLYLNYLAKKGIKVVTHKKNVGVADNKNDAIKFMVDQKCKHLFLIEDDIIMKYKHTCEAYIQYANKVGVQHMNFALHGPANASGPKYDDDNRCVYPNCVGAFSYYTRECIEKVGYMDNNFHNVWEHVEHTYRIGLVGLTTPFWQFVDHPLSGKFLEEIPGSIESSSIRPDPKWEANMINGKSYWISKWGSWLPPR